MLIFTAWADLLFFLISVNFRICLSSRLTPFLELPWNLKNKTRNYHWKKSRRPIGSRKATHARWSLRVGPEGAPGVGRSVQLCPQLPHVDTQLPQPPSPQMAVITHTSQRKALPLQRLTDTRDVDTLAEHTVWNSFCLECSDRYIAQCHTHRPPGEGFRCSYTTDLMHQFQTVIYFAINSVLKKEWGDYWEIKEWGWKWKKCLRKADQISY